MRAALAVCVALWAGAVGASTHSDRIDGAAEVMRRAAGEDAHRTAAAAFEAATAAMRAHLRDLAAEERVLADQLNAGRDTHRRLLGALIDLTNTPGPARLTHPAGPDGMARAAQLLSGLADAALARTNRLTIELGDLRALKSAQDATLSLVRAARAEAQADRRQALGARLRPADADEAPSLGPWRATAARRMSDFARRARRHVIAPIASFDAAKGALPAPAEGKLTVRFGDTDDTGAPRTGVVIAAPAYTQVRAPWAATVRHVGPLRKFGEVMILEPEADHLIVLAGLEKITRGAGETVLPGETLGQLGLYEPLSDEFLIDARDLGGTSSLDTLYIEVRENGSPVDPALWFRFVD